MNTVSEAAYERFFPCICQRENSSLVKKVIIFDWTFIDSYNQIPHPV